MAQKILIIEDDTFLIGMEAKKLKDSGYDVLTATHSIDAFKILEAENAKEINLILLDLLLPDVDGFSILQKIRENPFSKDIPVIVFSNIYDENEINKVRTLGISEFLIKSNFTLDELVEKIKKII